MSSCPAPYTSPPVLACVCCVVPVCYMYVTCVDVSLQWAHVRERVGSWVSHSTTFYVIALR